MDTSLENHSPDPDAILKLVKDAIGRCRESSIRFYGFARGLEIGISTLKGATSNDSIECLQERSLRLSASRDDYHLGFVLGINLASEVASAMFAQVQADK